MRTNNQYSLSSPRSTALLIVLVLGSDLHLALTTELLDLDGTVELGDGSLADFLGSDRLVKAYDIGTATGEVDTVGKALGEDGNQGDEDEGAGNDIGPLACAYEVEVGVLEEVLGEPVLERDVLSLLDTVVEDQTGDEDGSKNGSDDTDDERGGEALDGTGTEHEEHDTGEEGGHLSVDDGGISVLVTVSHSLAQALAGGKLLLDTFIYDHVRIHSHTHGQDQTGNTRQGQDCSEGNEDSKEEKHVAEEGDVSCDTCALIEEYHVDEDEQEGDQEGNHTGLDRLCTEGRSHYLLLDDGGRGGKLTGLQNVHEVGSLIRSEVSGDGGLTSGDGAVDVRIGIHHTVEDDGDLPSDIVTGHAGPDVGAFGVHAHGD